jgi:hypothetical protein
MMAILGKEEFDLVFFGGSSFSFSTATGDSPEWCLAFARYCS